MDLNPTAKKDMRELGTALLFLVSIITLPLIYLAVVIVVGNLSLDIQLHDTVFVFSYSIIFSILALFLLTPAGTYFLSPVLLAGD